MELTRRDLLRASSAVAVGLGLKGCGVQDILNPDGQIPGPPDSGTTPQPGPIQGDLQVVWLQGQACTGCSVSLVNSIYYATIDELLLNSLDLKYHPNLMAAAGSTAIAAAEEAYSNGNYALVVEGAIPTAQNGLYCSIWNGMTMLDAVTRYASKASAVLAVGTCASYGGMVGGSPNPTAAKGVAGVISNKPLINIPGCPAHPDWVVGSIAYLMKYGKAPALDSLGRPRDYYPHTVHDRCPLRETEEANTLGVAGRCLKELGCHGPRTMGDCPIRKWNSGAANQYGYNWCIGAGSPCIGCTEQTFPDGMSPFYFGGEVEGGGDGGRDD